MILTIRTDKPEAEIGLYDNDGTQLAYKEWQAHRQLSETILTKIEALLHSDTKDWADITGLACFKGPGSFTGLRIGLTVGNALATSLKVPVVGDVSEDWKEKSIARLKAGENEHIIVPHYGREAHITLPRK